MPYITTLKQVHGPSPDLGGHVNYTDFITDTQSIKYNNHHEKDFIIHHGVIRG